MTRHPAALAPNHSLRLILAFSILIIAAGLLGWRSISIFAAPANINNSSSDIATLLETVTGPDTVRIGKTDTNGFLILINRTPGQLAPEDEAQITRLMTTLYPEAPLPVIEHYVFAAGAADIPATSELAELAALGLVSLFALMVVLFDIRMPALRPADLNEPSVPEQSAPSVTIQNKAAYTTPGIRSGEQNRSASPELEKVTGIIEQDPQAAASILKSWLHPTEARS